METCHAEEGRGGEEQTRNEVGRERDGVGRRGR